MLLVAFLRNIRNSKKISAFLPIEKFNKFFSKYLFFTSKHVYKPLLKNFYKKVFDLKIC